MAPGQAAGEVEAAIGRLAGELDQITRIVRFEPALLELRIERVSRWSIGQQIDHTLKVLEVGLPYLDGPREPLPRAMNFYGRLALALRWFPRGLGKSPRGVLPGEWTPAGLAERASRLRKAYCDRPLPAAALADSRPVFPHPYFGGLTAAQGVRFLDCHTHHHLKIVADIRRRAPERRDA